MYNERQVIDTWHKYNARSNAQGVLNSDLALAAAECGLGDITRFRFGNFNQPLTLMQFQRAMKHIHERRNRGDLFTDYLLPADCILEDYVFIDNIGRTSRIYNDKFFEWEGTKVAPPFVDQGLLVKQQPKQYELDHVDVEQAFGEIQGYILSHNKDYYGIMQNAISAAYTDNLHRIQHDEAHREMHNLFVQIELVCDEVFSAHDRLVRQNRGLIQHIQQISGYNSRLYYKLQEQKKRYEEILYWQENLENLKRQAAVAGMVDTRIQENLAQTDVMTNGRRVGLDVEIVEGANKINEVKVLDGFVKKDYAIPSYGGFDREVYRGGAFGGSGGVISGGDLVNGGFGKGGMFDRGDGFAGLNSYKKDVIVDPVPERVVLTEQRDPTFLFREPSKAPELVEKIVVEQPAQLSGEKVFLRQPTKGGEMIEKIVS